MYGPSIKERGFTLIELSIVLVIIGLIVGGVLVGQDLINASAIRAQISQIEKYNAAVNTFQAKYDALPGDMTAATATQFGFAPRGSGVAQGDGDGMIEGMTPYANVACGFCVTTGETTVFWEDLTTANGLNVNLIEGGFSTASISNSPVSAVTGTAIDLYLPRAKIGNGNYIHVWAGGPSLTWNNGDSGSDGFNYYGLSAVKQLAGGNPWQMISSPGLSVRQAADIDKKIDDGLPQSGTVIAAYISVSASFLSPAWAGTSSGGPAYTTAVQGSSTTCFDNANGSGAQTYSLAQHGGAGINCALSFRFQ